MISRNDLSLAAVRLLALYLLVVALRNAAALFALWRSEPVPDGSGLEVFIPFLCLAPLVVAVALSIFSRAVARWVLPSSDGAVEPMPGVSLVQSVAIGTFGLLLIAVDLPGLVSNVLSLDARNKWLRTSYSLLEDPQFLRDAVSVGMGVALCAGASFWSRLITALRGLGGADVRDSTT